MAMNLSLIQEELRRNRRLRDQGRGGAPGVVGGVDTSAPGTTVSTTSFAPSGTRPSRPKMPTFTAPKLDRRAIAAETQREAAPAIRRLRDVTARSLAGSFENPNVRRMTVREALQGYGSGLASVLQGARRSAMQTALPEYTAQVGAAQRSFEANVGMLQQEYNNAWREFLTAGTTTTTQQRS